MFSKTNRPNKRHVSTHSPQWPDSFPLGGTALPSYIIRRGARNKAVKTGALPERKTAGLQP